MRTAESPRAIAGILIVVLLVSGCAKTMAPHGWLPDAESSGRRANGGWIVAKLVEPAGREVQGELIAVEAESLFIVTNLGFEVFPISSVKKAQVASYDSGWGPLVTWTFFGTIFTASHGFGLVLSAPLWVLVGSIATASASNLPIARYPGKSWTELSAHARFPQGLPAALDRSGLHLRESVP